MLVVSQALRYRLPSVSATVLPRRESAARLARLATGDSESSMASRLSNIISPYSSYGSSNGQYISLGESSSSVESVISESSCEGPELVSYFRDYMACDLPAHRGLPGCIRFRASSRSRECACAQL